jgi:hypothetical protein
LTGAEFGIGLGPDRPEGQTPNLKSRDEVVGSVPGIGLFREKEAFAPAVHWRRPSTSKRAETEWI